ncbi:glutamine--fructose-6-phosphate transaminase (isomerizing), partial [Candidatus Microgenomates bacterium]|nr:glutamine--fructose-6-phosphate transaminase (isomerizing) [Candidatus Microgenomates bacterium]
MCGIVGYCGQSGTVLNTLVAGLKRLEYRGYDSAGVTLLTAGSVYTQKTVGKVVALEKAISSNPPVRVGTVGIAHTRWATHGLPTLKNAHPHSSQDQNIWLVHNGIIENYQEIRSKLQRTGVKFKSDTDSEVVAQLIGSLYQGDLRQAVLKTVGIIKGAYALAIVCAQEPHRLIGVKMSSPLVVGVADAEMIIASDVSALIDKTKRVVYLEDGELIDIQGTSHQIVGFDNVPVAKSIANIDWDVAAASKGGYDHFLLKEIMEQPQVIQDSTRGRLDEKEANIHFGGLLDVEARLSQIDRVILLGIGTAYYAAKLGELYFNSLANLPAVAYMSPEFRYNQNVLDSRTWVIAISQSGETADTIAAVQEAKRQGALVTGIVNVVGSTISRITDAGVYNHIGPEISVASTKAFTSQSLILLMHALLLGRQRGLAFAPAAEIIRAIKRLPTSINKVLSARLQIQRVAKGIATAKHLIYIGRQYNYPIALEGALKIKEISYIHAEG